jgi:hypothetical protein
MRMMKMASKRSNSNKGIAKPQYTGLTYGTTEEVNKLIIDKRKQNIPPAATNTIDNTRNAQEATETTEVVAETTSPRTQGRMPIQGLNLNILRDMDSAESPTFGAVPVQLPPEVVGDMDYEVLADLSENTEVQALIEILGL